MSLPTGALSFAPPVFLCALCASALNTPQNCISKPFRITFHPIPAIYLVLSTKVYLTNITQPRYPEPQTWTIHFFDAHNLGISSLPDSKIHRCQESV